MRQIISKTITTILLFGFLVIPEAFNGQSLDATILSEMSTEKLPSVSVVIVKDGEVVLMRSYGEADVQANISATPQTPYLLASVSKTFTATALMQCVQDGLIDLDADIDTYLPFSTRNPNHSATPITARMLITHTSSIQDAAVVDTYYAYGTDPVISLSDMAQRYFSTAGADFSSANFLSGAPGTVYEYSNMGNALAGYLVEAVTGQLFYDYCNASIFDRLCMENTSWRLADYDTIDLAKPYAYSGGNYVPYQHYTFADYPNGGLRSTVEDLANYLIMYQQNGVFNGDTVLDPAIVSDMLSFQVGALEPTQGIAWYMDTFYPDGSTPVDLWTHNGGESGVSSDMVLYPAYNAAVAVVSNGEGTCAYIADALLGEAEILIAGGSGNPSCATGVAEAPAGRSILAFPNPTAGIVDLGEALHEMIVVNVLGEVIDVQNTTQFIDISNWSSGVYQVRAKDMRGLPVVAKIVRE